jgi:hypothetical protein
VIVRGVVSPDDIYMLVSCPPDMAPAKLVPYLKGRSSRRLQDESPDLRKRYWGQHLWPRASFCASVGAVDEETIKKYLKFIEAMGGSWRCGRCLGRAVCASPSWVTRLEFGREAHERGQVGGQAAYHSPSAVTD